MTYLVVPCCGGQVEEGGADAMNGPASSGVLNGKRKGGEREEPRLWGEKSWEKSGARATSALFFPLCVTGA